MTETTLVTAALPLFFTVVFTILIMGGVLLIHDSHVPNEPLVRLPEALTVKEEEEWAQR